MEKQMVSIRKQNVRIVEETLDDLWNSGSVLVRPSGRDWSTCAAEAADTLGENTKLAPVSGKVTDAVDHVLGEMNLPTDIVLMRLPAGGYAIRIFEIENQLDTLDRSHEAAEYVMKRMAAVRKARDGLNIALHRRLAPYRVLEVNLGGLMLMRGVNLPADFRAAVDQVTEFIEVMLADD